MEPLTSVGEVGARSQGIGLIGAQDPLEVGEGDLWGSIHLRSDRSPQT